MANVFQTSDQIATKTNELLADIAAATYVSEVARILTDTVNWNPKSPPSEEVRVYHNLLSPY